MKNKQKTGDEKKNTQNKYNPSSVNRFFSFFSESQTNWKLSTQVNKTRAVESQFFLPVFPYKGIFTKNIKTKKGTNSITKWNLFKGFIGPTNKETEEKKII